MIEVERSIGKKHFPKLMISSEGKTLILFKSKHQGTVIQSTDKFYEVGLSDDGWNSAMFTDYEGSITLSNK